MVNDNRGLSAFILALSLFFFTVSTLASTGLSILNPQPARKLAAKDRSMFKIRTSFSLLDRQHTSALYLLKILSFSLALIAIHFLIANRWNMDWRTATLAVVIAACILSVIYKLSQILANRYAEQIVLRMAVLIRIITWTFSNGVKEGDFAS